MRMLTIDLTVFRLIHKLICILEQTKDSGAVRIPGLRFTSWILYGVAIVHFAFFFMWPTIASGNTKLPDGQITVDATIFLMASYVYGCGRLEFN
jgi:hypothetical protein